MEEFIVRVGDLLGVRLHGPLALRIVLQPAVACFLAIRAGLRDARQGRPAYFWAVLSSPGHRVELLREGWKDIVKIFLIAILLDGVYQFVVTRTVRPGEALFIGILLAVVPYLLVRGPVTRLARRRGRHGG